MAISTRVMMTRGVIIGTIFQARKSETAKASGLERAIESPPVTK